MIKSTREPKQFNTITASYPLENVQIDIMIYNRFSFHNYNNILCCVDVYSRFATCMALTNRKIPNIVEKLDEMFKDIGYPKNINCDNEFNVKEVNEWAKNKIITMYYSQPYEVNKNAIVERFNRTLAQLLQNWRQATKQYDWYRVLPDIVYNYNHNHHSTIKTTPQQVFDGKKFNVQAVFKIENPFKVGDKVRTKNESNIFSKGDILKFNKTIYTIDNIDGQKIYLANEEGILLSKFFKPYQLVKVVSVEKYEKPNESHEEEHKIIQKQRKRDKSRKADGLNKFNILEGKRERRNKEIFKL